MLVLVPITRDEACAFIEQVHRHHGRPTSWLFHLSRRIELRRNEILTGDALTVLRTLPDESVQCCVTSPPYWGLRDYGMGEQLGREGKPAEYVARLVEVFAEVRRVLAGDGTLWMNLGDCYANDGKWGGSSSGKRANGLHGATGIGRGRRDTGLKAKDLVGIPWAVAFALREDGWYLRADIVWHKPNPMPEPVQDRPTKAHEYLFLLSKSERYFYDAGAIAEPIAPATASDLRRFAPKVRDYEAAAVAFGEGTSASRRNAGNAFGEGDTRNARSVWSIAVSSYDDAHFATFPDEIPRRCILAGSRVGDVVIDPFTGSGTTCAVADAHQRGYIGIELNPEYAAMARRRVERMGAPLFSAGAK